MVISHLTKAFCVAFTACCLFTDTHANLSTITNNDPNEKLFVTCRFRGQLGNQLFQTATTLAYAWDFGVDAYFPDLNNTGMGNLYNKDHIFFRLNSNCPPRAVLNEYVQPNWYCANKIPFKKDLLLKGFFQSWKHFHHYRDQILEVFSPLKEDLSYLENKYKDLIDRQDTVAVNVRTYSSLLHRTSHPFVGLEYYQRSFDQFPKETLFVVFSDRIEWCKIHFPAFGKNIVFIDGNDHIQDLYLFSMMKHQIIANSSFSWWGAYLNKNPSKVVIVPLYWMRPSYHLCPPQETLINDLYLPEWKVVTNNFNIPYPEDLGNYGPTKSLDNYNYTGLQLFVRQHKKSVQIFLAFIVFLGIFMFFRKRGKR